LSLISPDTVDYINLVNKDITYDFRDLQVYDVTLRDGEQTPGVAFSVEEKLHIAKMLNTFGIKYIEAGFPAVSEEEKVAVKKIVNLALNSDIYGFCRLVKDDIDIAINCGVKHIVLFFPGSSYMLESKMNLTFHEGLERIKSIIDYAKKKNVYVRFGCEDASRTAFDKLLKMYNAAIDSGADMVTFADTIGVMTPLATYQLVKEIINSISVPLAIHCHNDYGLGLANTLSALEAGVKQVHVSINGLGERAGNVSLEEFVMTLLIQYKTDFGYKLDYLYEMSEQVYKYAGLEVPFNKPIVGEKVFQHESGIHVQGILKDPRTYQPFPAEIIGRKNEVILGKHSGVSNIKYYIEKFKLTGLTEDKIQCALKQIKHMAGRKEEINASKLLKMLTDLSVR